MEVNKDFTHSELYRHAVREIRFFQAIFLREVTFFYLNTSTCIQLKAQRQRGSFIQLSFILVSE